MSLFLSTVIKRQWPALGVTGTYLRGPDWLSRPAWSAASLLLAAMVFLAVACGGSGRNMGTESTTGTKKSEVQNREIVWDERAVWKPSPGCFSLAMCGEGIQTQQALAFSKAAEQAGAGHGVALASIQKLRNIDFGIIDTGGVYEFAVFLNGRDAIVPMEAPRPQSLEPALFADLQAAVPPGSDFWLPDPGGLERDEVLPNGDEELTFQFGISASCHACTLETRIRAAYTFGPGGNLVASRTLGLCGSSGETVVLKHVVPGCTALLGR